MLTFGYWPPSYDHLTLLFSFGCFFARGCRNVTNKSKKKDDRAESKANKEKQKKANWKKEASRRTRRDPHTFRFRNIGYPNVLNFVVDAQYCFLPRIGS